ncbi:hypothetical protein BU23DRAFT_661561, partial [Bimuria novae-zelandiae CBS 107.79]
PEWHFKRKKATRDKKSKGGIDWLRYRENVLRPKLYPWAWQISQATRRQVYIVKDNASLYDYLSVHQIERLPWPGHSPDVNASEHAWPWIRRHITKEMPQSTCEDECRRQWEQQ